MWYEVGEMLFDIDGCVDCKKLKSTEILNIFMLPLLM